MPPRKRKRSALLLDKAIDDYDRIMLDSLINWGIDQAQDYKRVLDAAIANVAVFPEMGRTDPELPNGFRTRFAGRHVICYEITNREVRIHRILHERQDLAGQFDDLE